MSRTPGGPGKRTRLRRGIGLLLVITLTAGLLVRMIGLGFGSGVLTPRADEELLRSGVLICLAGDPNPHYAVWGHLYHYIYSAVAALRIGYLYTVGEVDSWIDGIAQDHIDPDGLVWWGRLLSALAGTATIAATFRLAYRTTKDRSIAAGAAIILAMAFLHVRDSHFATSDVLLGLLCTLCLTELADHPANYFKAGILLGLALATKLLAVSVAIAFCSVLVVQTKPRHLGRAAATLITGGIVMILTQPFLVFDPMETWYGFFGDLFSSDRRPFSRGIDLRNLSIVLRYYVPQAISWWIGIPAVLGWMALCKRVRTPRFSLLVTYSLWSFLALVSVQRIFLRYLDPMLPVVAILASCGISLLARSVIWLVVLQHPWRGTFRLVSVVGLAMLLSFPNLRRCWFLAQQLTRTDTRALAGSWLAENASNYSRIYWIGYENIVPHLTMPWLEAPIEYDLARISQRKRLGLTTAVDERVIELKQASGAKQLSMYAVSIGNPPEKKTGIEAFPFERRDYEDRWLVRLDNLFRESGLLTRESPRWELMRRHIVGTVRDTPQRVVQDAPDFLVVTGMPCPNRLIELFGKTYDQVQFFDPKIPWDDYRGPVMYDLGDAWYLPNQGIHRVIRPGPEIRIFFNRGSVRRETIDGATRL